MSDLQNKKILIIEDEALVARELKSRLIQMGCEVVGIAYGNEGIELARRTQPDLLLTDIHLKDGEDGIDMARTIQAERDVPVVFLTAYSDEATVSRAKEVAPYGYIIKPVDNRELQIAIDMALYKFNIERELKDTQQLLQTALTCIGSALVFINEHGQVTDLNADAEEMLGKSRRVVRGEPWSDLFTLIGSSIENKINLALASNEVVKLAPFINHAEGAVPCLLDGIVGPMEQGGVLILRSLSEISDPIEALPTAGELMHRVGSERLAPSESSMCQLLISRLPSAPQDVLEDMSDLLNQQLRSTDLVSVYASSTLSVSMPYTSVNEGQLIANSLLEKLQSHFAPEQGEFCIGLSFSSPGDQQPFELFRRASWGLKVAVDSGGGRVIVWNDEVETPEATNQDQKQREYHNLVLLWNILNVVSNTGDVNDANRKLCSHLQRSFGMRVVGILKQQGDNIFALAGASDANETDISIAEFGLTQADFDLIKRLMSSQALSQANGKKYFCKLNSELLVVLSGDRSLKADDEAFLQTLLSYYAAGLSRFELPDQQSVVLDRSELLFESPRMKSLIETVQLVADTDATVLIMGESGTGKEMLARRIHETSERRDLPFIIVDCGAVVSSLIESELFGHKRGAFTGADSDFIGRLKEADGGTVLLDEIGELPLEVQVKLLRYVQDKEIAAVGSSQYQTVNTRIIAATNKDLKTLVSAGLFREDLFYRLNVFTIDSPPLRERGEDIMLLAQHYLAIYASQYKKAVTGFTAEAQRALLQYDWPGNIRELTNVINRAVILCKDSALSTIHLGLFPNPDKTAQEASSHALPTLQNCLNKLVSRILEEPNPRPIAQWLEEDLIYYALQRNAEVLNRAATDLGIPESTLRRKVQRLKEQYGSSAPQRPDFWRRSFVDLCALLEEFKASDGYLEQGTRLLLSDLEARDLGRKQAANLMGVSLPTYRRMLAESP